MKLANFLACTAAAILLSAVPLASCFSVRPTRASRGSFHGRRLPASPLENDDETYVANPGRRNAIMNAAAIGLIAASGVASASLFMTNVYTPSGFQRLPTTQFIAALGDPNARSGSGAKEWGLWREDPGPRGVWLRDYAKTFPNNNDIAPRGWKFDIQDWWLEEHGLIMEAPSFPIAPGRYLVTGGRAVTTGLTIHEDGRWELDEGCLFDVTHLPCRSARYHPISNASSSLEDPPGGPQTANLADFPVRPGAEMPAVKGCDKQDYAVLFVVGKAV